MLYHMQGITGICFLACVTLLKWIISHHMLRNTLLLVGQTVIGILFIWRESTGLFPFFSWEEVMSLVQMLFVRSQDGEALSWRATEEVHPNWITTMACASLYPISWGTMHRWWHFSHKHTKATLCFWSHMLFTFCYIFCLILIDVWSENDEPLQGIKIM